MKWFHGCRMRLVSAGFVAALALGGGSAKADFTFGEPTNLGPTVNSYAWDDVPCVSADDLELYFASWRNGGYGQSDIWVSTRITTEQEWGEPVNLGSVVNTPLGEYDPSISADGLELYIEVAELPPSGVCCTSLSIWVAKRTAKGAPWGRPVKLDLPVPNGYFAAGPGISADGLELYFCAVRFGDKPEAELYVARRETTEAPWAEPVSLGPIANDQACQVNPAITSDGLLLISTDWWNCSPRRGGFGGEDMWMTRRATKNGDWEVPVNLGSVVNTPFEDRGGTISADGSTLYFHSARVGSQTTDLWQAPILPVLDFNGDGQVDAKDMALLVDNWGQNEPLCDIGPFPWGDGVVDEKDLMVLMERLVTPSQNATDVPCNVVLSWASPEFVDSYDVYFGTSFEGVNNATREDPCGVMVSEGQTETTYDPEGLLAFSQTYYWRVDVVGPAPDLTIDRGLILKFTTEAYAYPIQNIVATASSSGVGMGPEKTVDGSGLDENDGHSTDAKDMWQSKSGPPQWIEVEFDQVYALHELWVWNSNTELESFMSFGAKDVTIEYSTDGTTWTPLGGVPEFAKAPGTPGYTANTIVRFAGISAKYVKLTIEKGWSAMPAVGLSEVRFFYVPDRAYVPEP